MPKLPEHCRNSKRRTDKDYRDLHEWMDEEQKYLEENHRIMRHDLLWLSAVKDKFKHYPINELVYEFIYHIIEDYQETLQKFKDNEFSYYKGKKV